MKKFIFIAIALALNITCIQARKQQFEDPSLLKSEPIKFKALEPEIIQCENGLEIWHCEDNSVPMISITLDMPVGNQNDPEDLFGVAELTSESIVRSGTESRSAEQLDQILESNAIQLSAQTDVNSTQITVSFMSQDLELALEIFMEILHHPGFETNRIELAKQTLANRILRARQYPFFEAEMMFFEIIYGKNHPLARVPDERFLKKIDRQDLVDYYSKYYKPEGAKVGLVGNYTRESLAAIQQKFSTWQGKLPVTSDIPAPKSLHQDQHITIIDKPGTQVAFVMGHLGQAPNTPERYAIDVFNNIFGSGGFSTRLMNIIRTQKGFAYSVYGGFRNEIPVGFFTAECQTKTANTYDAIQSILDIIDDLRKNEVSDTELKESIESIQNSYVFNYERPRYLMYRLFSNDRKQLPRDYMRTYLDRIRSIKKEDVLRVAESMIYPEKIQIVIVGPADEVKPLLEKLNWPIEVIKKQESEAANIQEHELKADQ